MVLLCTGTVLSIGEPVRELMNWLFYTKMVLVLALAALAAVFQQRIAANPEAFDTVSGQAAAKLLGGLSLLLILAIIAAGRWIAYVVGAG
jgi:uncharacterized membrane protein